MTFNLTQAPSKVILTPEALSRITLLVAQYRLSPREVKQLLADFFNLHISIGTISNAERLVSEALNNKFKFIQKAIQQSSHAHLDETSHRRSGKTEWLWVACNDKVSLFKIFDNRAQSSAKALIGEHYQGMAITDRYGAYRFLSSLQRQYCWAHLKRDFVRLSEKLNPEKAFIGQCLLSTMRRIFYGYKKPTIDPTNNLAERNFRHAVRWRKKTFRTRSARGNQFVKRTLTVMMTAKQLGKNRIQALCDQLNLNKKVWVSS